VSIATWPEAEASNREVRVEDGAQDLIDRLLTHAVGYSGDTERAHLFGVRGFGDIDATNRKRVVAVFHELALKLAQVGFDVLLVGANRHPVETMDTLLALTLRHAVQRLSQL